MVEQHVDQQSVFIGELIETLGEDAPFALVADAYGADVVPMGSRRGLVSGSFFHAIATEP